jgi:predicted Rossmann fold nucleotide-binding protein DprA/Smf involved in DNA uptake
MSVTREREMREVIREEPLWHAPILAALAAGPRTVPEIARAIGRPADEVLLWVMGMRRYGLVAEAGDADDEGYFPYRAVGGGGDGA